MYCFCVSKILTDLSQRQQKWIGGRALNFYATEQKKLREIYCRYGEELWRNPELLERALNESFPGDSNKTFIQAVMSCAEYLGRVAAALGG